MHAATTLEYIYIASSSLAVPVVKMYSQGLRRFGATSRHVQCRNFSRTAPAKRIINPSGRLNAKEVSPMIGNKYPVIDHEYDALVVGAGGSGIYLPSFELRLFPG